MQRTWHYDHRQYSEGSLKRSIRTLLGDTKTLQTGEPTLRSTCIALFGGFVPMCASLILAKRAIDDTAPTIAVVGFVIIAFVACVFTVVMRKAQDFQQDRWAVDQYYLRQYGRVATDDDATIVDHYSYEP